MKKLSATSVLLVLQSFFLGACSFTPGNHSRRGPRGGRAAVASAATATITVERVTTPEAIMDVASFRNNCTSPTMMIQRQIEKRDGIDDAAPVINGLVVGLAAGVGAGAFSYLAADGDVEAALRKAGVVASVVFAALALSGKRAYVYTEAEAVNRLTVDHVAGLAAGLDVGFAARVDERDRGRYAGTNGVVGCVDCQLRNDDEDDAGADNAGAADKRYGTLPPHVSLKNLAVDGPMRRRGIARRLLDFVENDYARQQTNAEFLVLEVDQKNTAAVRLYEEAGFRTGDEEVEKVYRSFMIGRIVMTKRL